MNGNLKPTPGMPRIQQLPKDGSVGVRKPCSTTLGAPIRRWTTGRQWRSGVTPPPARSARGLWTWRCAWTTLARCPHTHSHCSSRQLDCYDGQNGAASTLSPGQTGPQHGVHFSTDFSTLARGSRVSAWVVSHRHAPEMTVKMIEILRSGTSLFPFGQCACFARANRFTEPGDPSVGASGGRLMSRRQVGLSTTIGAMALAEASI
jgi:hypothetical protein